MPRGAVSVERIASYLFIVISFIPHTADCPGKRLSVARHVGHAVIRSYQLGYSAYICPDNRRTGTVGFYDAERIIFIPFRRNDRKPCLRQQPRDPVTVKMSEKLDIATIGVTAA